MENTETKNVTLWERLLQTERAGETHTSCSASITREGSFKIGCYDYGGAPKEFFGFEDYEYEITVEAQHIPARLLHVVEAWLKGDEKAEEKITAILKEKNIPYRDWQWMTD